MTPPNTRGLSFRQLTMIAAFFVGLHVISLGIAARRPADLSDDFTLLSITVVFEVGSWAAFPIITWLFGQALARPEARMRVVGRLLVLCVVTELAFDAAVSGTLWSWNQMSVVWAFMLCVVIDAADRHLKGNSRISAAQRGAVLVAVILAAFGWVFIGGIGASLAGIRTGVIVIAFFLVFRYLRSRENTMMMSAAVLGAAFFLAPAIGVVLVHYRSPAVDSASGELPDAPVPLPWLVYAYPLALLAVAVTARLF